MKRTGALLLIIFSLQIATFSSLYAQEEESTKMTRKEKRETEKRETIINKQNLVELLKTQQFVLEASRVVDRYGQVTFVTPNINFIAFNDDHCVIQLAVFEGLAAWNNVGGVTYDGSVKSFRVEEGKETGDAFVDVRIVGAGIASNLLISVNPSGKGSVEFIGDRGEKLIFEGRVVPLTESTVYKGKSINR